jgi:hypothetical protein
MDGSSAQSSQWKRSCHVGRPETEAHRHQYLALNQQEAVQYILVALLAARLLQLQRATVACERTLKSAWSALCIDTSRLWSSLWQGRQSGRSLFLTKSAPTSFKSQACGYALAHAAHSKHISCGRRIYVGATCRSKCTSLRNVARSRPEHPRNAVGCPNRLPNACSHPVVDCAHTSHVKCSGCHFLFKAVTQLQCDKQCNISKSFGREKSTCSYSDQVVFLVQNASWPPPTFQLCSAGTWRTEGRTAANSRARNRVCRKPGVS